MHYLSFRSYNVVSFVHASDDVVVGVYRNRVHFQRHPVLWPGVCLLLSFVVFCLINLIRARVEIGDQLDVVSLHNRNNFYYKFTLFIEFKCL